MLTRCKNADLALCCGVCRATISYIHTVILTPSRRRRYMHAMQSTLNKLKLCSSTNPYSSDHLHSALLSITDSQEGKSYLVTGDSFLWRLDGYQWRVHHKRLCMNGRRVDMQWYSGARWGRWVGLQGGWDLWGWGAALPSCCTLAVMTFWRQAYTGVCCGGKTWLSRVLFHWSLPKCDYIIKQFVAVSDYWRLW